MSTDNVTELPTVAVEDEQLPPLPIVRGNPMSSFASPELFEQFWRGAKALAASKLIPAHFQGSPEDCFVALHMAHRLGADPIMVLQNLYIVHGNPGWSAKFIIGQANLSGVFKGRIRFRSSGEGKDLAVTAEATLSDTGEVVSSEVSMRMATAEGWSKNPKYQSMPLQMLSYRAAAFLVRLYCPEVLLGVQAVEEVEDLSYAGVTTVEAPGTGTEALKAAIGVTEPSQTAPPVEREPGEDDDLFDEEEEAI